MPRPIAFVAGLAAGLLVLSGLSFPVLADLAISANDGKYRRGWSIPRPSGRRRRA